MDGLRGSGVLARLARPRLYQQLADHISDFIEAQGLVPGDRLPPERQLATQLGVSRATLSRALVALEVSGRVEVRHGDGAVVLDPSAGAGALARVLSGYRLDELAAARGALMHAIALAAGSATGQPRADLEVALAGQDPVALWDAVRAAAGPGLLADLDDAMGVNGLTLGPDDLEAVRTLARVALQGPAGDLPA